MTIYLSQVSKRYKDQWVFKDLDYTFLSGGKYAILGANGSGKSTLLRTVANMQTVNKGTITYEQKKVKQNPDKVFQQLSFCAPGMEVVEEMTLLEFLEFHFSFKQLLGGMSIDSIIRALEMEEVKHKFIQEFSSGMKQRVKLAQSFFCAAPLLLLDEPCSNFDAKGVALYQDWLKRYTQNKTVIIASNDEREYPGINQFVFVENYK